VCQHFNTLGQVEASVKHEWCNNDHTSFLKKRLEVDDLTSLYICHMCLVAFDCFAEYQDQLLVQKGFQAFQKNFNALCVHGSPSISLSY